MHYKRDLDRVKEELARRKEYDDFTLIDKAFNELYLNRKDTTKNTSIDFVQSVLNASLIAICEIGLGQTSIAGFYLYQAFTEIPDFTKIRKTFGEQIGIIVEGLHKISEINQPASSSQAENFRNLIITLAKDVRVILIRLAERLELMREMKSLNENDQFRIASEASYLYAPLAHRLGLYLVKSEMEDLSLKYSNRETYSLIAAKLAEKMKARESFIAEFIKPVSEVLTKQGFHFEIKGRPKSIHSIWNKMRKKEVDFEDIYDLFAIRIIIESDLKNEKSDCWQVYSAVTDIFKPNPLRMRDWISIPKTNGYESLHTTVIGPDGKWVEVQIRTSRMNEIAEKGVAAHWKYKGMEGGLGLDSWLDQIREILEAPEQDNNNFIDDFKLSLYSKEIFVFTPKGDLRKFPKDATVLDFAFDIHTEVGSTCSGAKIAGKVVPIRHKLQNGDKVEIITTKNQKPNLDWLNHAVTSKAQKKIRQVLNEDKLKEAENGKETIKRRFKNWKIEYNDECIRILLKHYKLPNAQDFYYLVSTEKIDLAEVKEIVLASGKELVVDHTVLEDLEVSESNQKSKSHGDDFLVIDEKIVNIDYKLAKCCSPIMGDNVFGFVTISEGIKIHRTNCPNAVQLIGKYGYRVVSAKWTRTAQESVFPVGIKISGEDNTGILNKISEVLAKDLKVNVRSINMDADNGIFKGTIKLRVRDIEHLDFLISRLEAIKGVFSVSRYETGF